MHKICFSASAGAEGMKILCYHPNFSCDIASYWLVLSMFHRDSIVYHSLNVMCLDMGLFGFILLNFY